MGIQNLCLFWHSLFQTESQSSAGVIVFAFTGGSLPSPQQTSNQSLTSSGFCPPEPPCVEDKHTQHICVWLSSFRSEPPSLCLWLPHAALLKFITLTKAVGCLLGGQSPRACPVISCSIIRTNSRTLQFQLLQPRLMSHHPSKPWSYMPKIELSKSLLLFLLSWSHALPLINGRRFCLHRCWLYSPTLTLLLISNRKKNNCRGNQILANW